MKYRFYGDELQLIRYQITWTETDPVSEEETSATHNAASTEERDEVLALHQGAECTVVDNTGYEWLDGMTFTQEQLSAGELDKAIELGETAYTAYALASDPDAQLLEMDYRISLLELGVSENDLLSL